MSSQHRILQGRTVAAALFGFMAIVPVPLLAGGLLPIPEQPIVDIRVEWNNNDIPVLLDKDAPECPEGWFAVKDDVSLPSCENRGYPESGCGTTMDFVYGSDEFAKLNEDFSPQASAEVFVCYKRGPLTPASPTDPGPITRVTAAIDNCPAGFQTVVYTDGSGAADLNRGVGGDYVRLCFTRSTAYGFDYLLNLTARWNIGNDNPFTWDLEGYGDWSYIDLDLNSGAGGHYIWLGYQDTSDVNENRDCGGYLESACTVDTDFFWQNGSGSCDRGLREVWGTCEEGLGTYNRFYAMDEGVEDEWYVWAINNQRHGISQDEPINMYTQVGAHNAFNANRDGYFLDPNQYWSMSSVLGMGARYLMLDAYQHANQLRLAHCGDKEFFGIDFYDAGCSDFDRLFYAGIKEINDWLDAHPKEVIYIDLEDSSDRGPLEMAFALAWFGDKLYTEDSRESTLAECNPPFNLETCALAEPDTDNPEGVYRWPSVREMRKAGKQVFVAGGSYWRDNLILDLVRRGNDDYKSKDAKWLEPGWCDAHQAGLVLNPDFTVNMAGTVENLVSFLRVEEARLIIQTPNDSSDGGGNFTGLLSDRDVEALTRCNVSQVGLDLIGRLRMTPAASCNFYSSSIEAGHNYCDDIYDGDDMPLDPRLVASVWSWAENEPQNWGNQAPPGETAAYMGADGRWRSAHVTEHKRFACARPREGVPLWGWTDITGSEWRVTSKSGEWHEGWKICHEEFGDGLSEIAPTFAAPVNGRMNERLKQNAAGQEVWINQFYSQKTRAENPIAGGWVQNRRPVPDLSVASLTVNEGSRITFDPSPTVDPDADRLSFEWDFGDRVVATSDGAVEHVYADNAGFELTVIATDEHGAFRGTTRTVNVQNVAPVVDAGSDITIDEGGTAVLDAIAFTDAGTADTHTVSVNWGEGTTAAAAVTESPFGPPGDEAGMSGSARAEHVFGDDGVYTATACARDDDGGEHCDTVSITVNSVDPELDFDTSAALAFDGGDAFLLRRGESITLETGLHDEGSDDLTLEWRFPPSSASEVTTRYNDGAGPDAFPSPGPVFPVDDTQSLQANFDMPGVYRVELGLTDDDGGSAESGLDLLVTDNRTCTRDFAYWSQQFTGRGGRAEIDPDRLRGYIDVVRYVSTYFDDANLADVNAALDLMAPGGRNGGPGPDVQMVLAAWLNFASGGVSWDQPVPRADATFSELMARLDSALLNGEGMNAIARGATAVSTLAVRSRCDDAGPAELENVELSSP